MRTFVIAAPLQAALALFAFVMAPPHREALAGQPDRVLYRFHAGRDGFSPSSTLVSDAAGNLYGAASYGGGSPCAFYSSHGCGIIFELSPPAGGAARWAETILYRFQGGADGAFPGQALLRGADGTLYGITAAGGNNGEVCEAAQTGCGTVFALTPPGGKGAHWALSTLYAFSGASDGGVPDDLIAGATAGSFVGSTVADGDPTCRCGVVFSLAPPDAGGTAWAETVLYAFKGIPRHSNIGDGAEPTGVVFDGAGNLVGATFFGGHHTGGEGGGDNGTVFTLSPPEGGVGAWTETSLDRLGPSLSSPVSIPVIDGKGNIFGTTYLNAYQVIAGTAVPIAGFNYGSRGGYLPYGNLTAGADGSLYGTTIGGGLSGNGVVYSLVSPAGAGERWHENVLHTFHAGGDGSAPVGPLTLIGTNLFGTTLRGGNQGCQIDDGVGCGTVFGVSIAEQ
jgi:uncharacterized repeat protein (TIGR03803 family)